MYDVAFKYTVYTVNYVQGTMCVYKVTCAVYNIQCYSVRTGGYFSLVRIWYSETMQGLGFPAVHCCTALYCNVHCTLYLRLDFSLYIHYIHYITLYVTIMFTVH